jgi:hypothetical protein
MWILILKKYHRQFLWITLGLLFALDIVTSTIGLQKGGIEQNPFMIPFVENPLLHLLVKIIALVFVFILIEGSLKLVCKITSEQQSFWNKLSFQISYGLIILGLVYFNWLFLTIVINNIIFIYS